MNNKIVMCFPGQGSQSLNMLNTHIERSKIFQDCFTEASDILNKDLWALIHDGPAEQLQLTENTQPVLLSASVALWRYWQECDGPTPMFMAGHSLGEFSALVCAGALDFADALRLVQKRGQLMQTAVPVGDGAMYAVLGLESEKIEAICTKLSGDADNDSDRASVVELVNYNAPGQMVIAGHTVICKRAAEDCLASGAKRCVALSVSAPFHTSLMRPIAKDFAKTLDSISIKTPNIAVIHNVHASPESDPENIRQLLLRQLYSPVRWIECVRWAVEHGAECSIECGPAKVLTGLAKRIDKNLISFALDPIESMDLYLKDIGS